MKLRLAFAALLAVTHAAVAQTVQTRVSPDTIRVGDPFRAIVRIELASGDTRVWTVCATAACVTASNAANARRSFIG
ncbi:MAG: hypothetical protein ACT443_01035, partial [Gemmatimonadota bacterium]